MGAEILEFQLALLDDPTPGRGALSRRSPAGARPRIGLAPRPLPPDPVLRGCRGRVLPGARRRPAATWHVRVLRALGGTEDRPLPLLPGAIVVDEDLTPSSFLALDWSVWAGSRSERGSPSSHVAMLARARGVPMATNLGEVPESGEARARRRGGRSWSSGPTRRPARAIAAGSTSAGATMPRLRPLLHAAGRDRRGRARRGDAQRRRPRRGRATTCSTRPTASACSAPSSCSSARPAAGRGRAVPAPMPRLRRAAARQARASSARSTSAATSRCPA